MKSPSAGFEMTARADLPALGVVVEQYRHRASGARHVHLAREERTNAFLVGFLTPPPDDSGVVHILEHLTLSGSRGFPMRDAFFRMLHRSLATTMNARTAADSTSFHFATSNERDFEHLLALYLDAVFFPLLDPLDFAREGHRVEFERPADPAAPLVRQGVVWNEMRGAMASPARLQRQALDSALFPDACYRHNPGGDPLCISALEHSALCAYHARHYCAANAVLMTAGGMPAASHHQRFERLALSACEPGQRVSLPDVPRFAAPRRVSQLCAGAAPGSTHQLLGWLLGRADDAGETLRAALLDRVLLGDGDAPLRALLDGYPGAGSRAAVCGLDAAPREMVFGCGLQDVNDAAVATLEADCLSLIDDVASDGVATARSGAALERLALERRAPASGRLPTGLGLLMHMLPAALRGADPVAMIDVDAGLRALETEARDPAWLPALVRAQLLDNPHRAAVTLVVDPSLAGARAAAERETLRRRAALLDDDARAAIIEQTRRIAAGEPHRGERITLPTLSRTDVGAITTGPVARRVRLGALTASVHLQPANGVTDMLLALMPVAGDVDDLALFCDLLPELGCGALDPRAAQARQAVIGAGLAAHLLAHAAVNDAGAAGMTLTLTARALDRRRVELARMLVEMIREPWLDDTGHLRAVLSRLHARRRATLTDAGHRFAMSAAADGATPAATLHETAHGLRALARLAALRTADADELHDLSRRLRGWRERLCSARCEVALVHGDDDGDRQALAGALAPLAVAAGAATADTSAVRRATTPRPRSPVSLVCETEVGFVARAWPAPAPGHADAPVLAVLGPLVADGFLHGAVRERGGAYGAGAMYDADSATFRLFSYRDPRIAGTLDDFDRVLAWLEQASGDERAVEHAVLRAIAAGEAGGSSADIALRSFVDTLGGRDGSHRQRWRHALLAVDGAALRRVAAEWLSPATARDAVIASESALAAAGWPANR